MNFPTVEGIWCKQIVHSISWTLQAQGSLPSLHNFNQGALVLDWKIPATGGNLNLLNLMDSKSKRRERKKTNKKLIANVWKHFWGFLKSRIPPKVFRINGHRPDSHFLRKRNSFNFVQLALSHGIDFKKL